MSEVSAWGKVWQINGRSLRALCCGWLARLCWQGYQVGIDWLILFAAMFAVGAVWHGVIAVFQTVKAIAGMQAWGSFKKKGNDPKADRMADRDALRKRGLL
ncbi:hypothetical protein [uncultured Roseobacter sp.]|uniref:hypothetical protein n=1 Tax=uncultured Roseobacter sp. TaxID=114847 RepID=UPI00261BA701|nr:hypothetical protein [uncultured Roseobacter sp.]